MALVTFRGTPCELLADSDWVSAPPPPEVIESRRPIPFSGGEVIIDDGGRGLSVWQVAIRVLTANVAAWLANVGQVGPLVTNDGTFANSKLSQLTNRRGTPSPGGSNRTYVAFDAEFICSP